jgi:hypothetical protein
VRFHSHIHPSIPPTAGCQLTPEEEKGLIAAVDKHGSRNWAMVAAESGLAWPPWRLLQAFRRVQTRAVTTEGFNSERDSELLAVTKRLMVVGATNRQVSWLVCHSRELTLGSVQNKMDVYGHCCAVVKSVFPRTQLPSLQSFCTICA